MCIFDKKNTMKLSIYVGLRAIAWIISEGEKVVKHGVKRVNLEFDHYYEYIAGQPVSLRVNRRMKRQARRNLFRYKSRRKYLKFLLKQNGIVSTKKLNRSQMLNLRVRGLTEKLNREELYHVLISLQSRRGYKSLRGVSDNDSSDYLQTIAMHEENRKQFKSIADYLLSLPSSKNIIFNRKSYEEEFWQIMSAQNLPSELVLKLFITIYFQRPLKKGAIGNCKVEPGRKVMHASHPLFQEFRCWRDAMNIIVWDEDMNEVEIPDELRHQWANYLFSGKNLTKASVCKGLGIKKSTNYSWLSGKQLAGNPVAGISYELWQDLFSAVENEQLRRLLAKKYNFSDFEIDRLVDLDLHKLGYAEYSTKAVRKLLPEIQTLKKLSEAILDVYGKVEMKEVALRNVVLEKHFDSYKSLIERIKKDYPITEVKFEIDHLLKAGNKQRKEMAKRKRAEQKFDKENEAILAGRSQYDRLKFKLWKESEGVSPYEPDVIIPLEELFTDKYDLDHIVPKSKLFETGRSNMVLCRKELNQKKGRKLATEFAKELGIDEDTWKEVAEKFGSKKQFLLMDETPKDWISRRQNSDYNTKCFGTLADVNIPNKLINKFMGEWNLRKYDENDCRYFLYKAFVLANLDQSVVERYDRIAEIGEKVYQLDRSVELPEGFENVIPYLPKPKLTRKTQYGYHPAKQLHQETILGKREIGGETFYKVRQPLTKLTPRMIKNVYDVELQKALEAWIAEHGDIEKAKASLEEESFFYLGNIVGAVSVKMTNTDLPYLRHKSPDGTIHSKTKEGTPVDFVYGENNYALEVKFENGKEKRRLITLLEHVDNLNGERKPYEGILFQKFDTVKYNGEIMYFIGCGESNQLRSIYHLNASETIKSFKYNDLEKIQVNQLGSEKSQ